MNAYEWLGAWEDIAAPGRHSRRYPAEDAKGYRFGPPIWSGVGRAIPVDGTVSEPVRTDWERSPQVRYWLKPEKKSLAERIREWMVKPA